MWLKIVVILIAVCCCLAQSFSYCGAAPEVFSLRPNTPTSIGSFTVPGSTLSIDCLQLTTTGFGDVALFVTCQASLCETSEPSMKLGKVKQSISTATNFTCPSDNGYFYFLAVNRGMNYVNMSWSASGSVNGVQEKLHQSKC